jgi:hypothetical protein
MRPQAKYNGLYTATFDQEGVRHARKIRLCDACFDEHITPYMTQQIGEDRLACPSCHIDTEDDYNAVYVTVYMPGYDAANLEFPFCGSCRDVFAGWAEQLGVPLEDRRRVDIDPSIHPSGLEVLRAMGIQPRVR